MNEILTDNVFYTTSDLALAAVIALDYAIEAIDHQPHEAQFVFRRDSYLDDLLEAYRCGELTVEPQAYYCRLRTLQKRLEKPSQYLN